MPPITIEDYQLGPVRNKVVVITGGSSGIGFATAEKLLLHGAKVVIGDLNPPPSSLDSPAVTFQTCNVTSWPSLIALFDTAKRIHGRVDHVFANAGIGHPTKESYVSDIDTDPTTGALIRPDHVVLEVNLLGVMDTVRLAIHHFRTQLASLEITESCSVVITASSAAFTPFRLSEYAASKHGVLGFARSLREQLKGAGLAGAIRVNTVAPAFTDTAIIDVAQVRAMGFAVQSAEVVARSVVWLMADLKVDQWVVYSYDGEYREVEAELLEGWTTAGDARGKT